MPLVDAIVAAHLGARARHLNLLRLTVRSAGGEWAVPCQIEGEVLHLAPDSGLIIDCAPHAVATVARTPT